MASSIINEDQCIDIIRITPWNILARQDFDKLACAISSTPTDSLLHARQFMQINETTIEADSIIGGIYNEESGPESESEAEDIKWNGGWWKICFCGRHQPEHPRLGWKFGHGRSGEANDGVDLRLALGHRRQSGLAGRHGRFYFNSYGKLMIELNPKRPSIYLGGQVIDKHQPERVVASETMMTIGSYTYKIGFTAEASRQHGLRQWARHLRMVLNVPRPAPDVTPTPSNADITLGKWTISNTVGKGTFAAVSVAVDMNRGIVIAAKRFEPRTRKQLDNIKEEVELIKALPEHVRIVFIFFFKFLTINMSSRPDSSSTRKSFLKRKTILRDGYISF